MKLSKKTIDQLYDAIYNEITDARIMMKLSANDDYILAQVLNKIWAKQKRTLKLP